ncbi:MAG: amidohydrolase family protein, partial [Propionicimonas sp.]
MVLLSAGRILFPEADAPVEGWLEVDGDRIVAAGTGPAPRPADHWLEGTVVPGYVDVHSHGGGGSSFVTEDPDEARAVLAAHRRLGVTTMVASLVTGSVPDLKRQVACLAGLVEAGELAGIHLEGPWLAPRYTGAHPPLLLADPRPDAVAELLAAGRGTVRMVTIAPERPGALESIRLLAAQGVVAAVGHTDADFETSRAAIEAGARGATHLFNAMAPLRHRAPGPVLALWQDRRVFLELIMDGVHVSPELVAFVMSTAPGRVVLVTDAMAAAAGGDGDYVLGELPVEVRDAVARIAGTDTIAGSTLTLDRAVRNAVAAGVPLAQAVR